MLDTKTVQQARGQFSLDDLREIWEDTTYPVDKHPELLQLMIRFELCFQLGQSRDYVAPELLSLHPPVFAWDDKDNLQFEYHYTFMPAGILTRFMARKHELIENNTYWKNGVVLRWNENRALVVSEPLNRKLIIRVSGDDKAGLLAVIRQELQYIHRTLNNPEVKQMIPCICPTCRRGNPFFFDYATLHRYRNAGETEIICDTSIQRVPIAKLLSGVLPENRPVPDPLDTTPERVIYAEYYYEGLTVPMKNTPEPSPSPKSPWTTGSFYLLIAVTMLAALAVIGKTLNLWILPVIILGGLLLTTVVGGFQLKQDERLKEENFLQLMEMAFKQIPLLGKLAKENQDNTDSESRSSP
ncbi:MAG: hypothetical protein ETSY1_10985 [Candidatus Entotheonella factor]|uniref:Uncharacterized protein n=1 Tax=Entotheonella factor TaxID=1429438 RepID=W4LSU3_ENTF1|nr:MAG: hypothetical protein ETSY1_10985 [Candidatus Entotheonella factor]